MKRFFLACFLLLCAVSSFGKIHIHTDAADYRAGERIWFRIYLLDAGTLLPDTVEQLLFVELITPGGEVTKRVKLIRYDDIFSGHIDLSPGAEAGQYLLRAYTRNMESRMDLAGRQIIYVHGRKSSRSVSSVDSLSGNEIPGDTMPVPRVAMPLSVSTENGVSAIRIDTASLHPREQVFVSVSVIDRYALPRHDQWTILHTYAHAPFDEPQYMPMSDYAGIAGYVTTTFRKKRVPGVVVNMIVPGINCYASDTTDENGRFAFGDEWIPENKPVLLTAFRQDGRHNVLIRIEEETFPMYQGVAPALLRTPAGKTVSAYELHDIADSVLLDELEVHAQRLIRESQKELHTMHMADMSFGMNKIEEYNATCLHDLLRRVPGVRVFNEQCFIRSATSIYAKNPAAIAIDGVIQDGEYDLDLIPMQDIARLDIFKSGTTAIWGPRGGSGVISIILKDGSDIPRQTEQTNLKRCQPLGWQLPQTFFLEPQTDPSRRPGTLFWEPNLRTGTILLPVFSPGTTYECIMEGVTSHGRLIREQYIF